MSIVTEYREKEMYGIIEDQKRSGFSQMKYCKTNSIAISTFSYWRKKYKKAHAPNIAAESKVQKLAQPPSFIPIEIVPEPNALKEQLEILYPNGVKIICPLSLDKTKLQELLQLV